MYRIASYLSYPILDISVLIDDDLYDRIVRKKNQLDTLRPLPKSVLARLRERFAIELAYNSNAIEGNTLSLRETRLVIEDGMTIKGKPLREHLEAVNHQRSFEYIEGLVSERSRITEDIVRRLHEHILERIDDEYAGRYRDVNVRILGARRSPPRYEKVPGLMRELLSIINENPDGLNTVEMAAFAHYRFVAVHPFVDGNGRCARLLMNILLMQHGDPITIVRKVDRKKYYDRLRRADDGDIAPFVHFIARNVEMSLDLYLDAFEPGQGFISLAEAARNTPYSQEYLSLLARRGRLEAVKIGRNWHVTRKALDRYIASKKR